MSGKQAMNPEKDAIGALKAGYDFNNLSQLQVIGYRYHDDSTINATQKELFETNQKMRENFNVLTTQEVKKLIIFHIHQIQCDIQASIYFYCQQVILVLASLASSYYRQIHYNTTLVHLKSKTAKSQTPDLANWSKISSKKALFRVKVYVADPCGP